MNVKTILDNKLRITGVILLLSSVFLNMYFITKWYNSKLLFTDSELYTKTINSLNTEIFTLKKLYKLTDEELCEIYDKIELLVSDSKINTTKLKIIYKEKSHEINTTNILFSDQIQRIRSIYTRDSVPLSYNY